MFKIYLEEKEITFEVKELTSFANSSVLVSSGDTVVLVTTVMGKKDIEDLDFFPLTVEYEERYYAAGKIKGPRFIKRELRPSDIAICNARLIDRAIRPLFPKELKREVQVIATVLSWDKANEPDILGVLGASLALLISDIPWEGPIAALRIGKKKNGFCLNPYFQEREESSFEVVFSITKRNERILINMIEGAFNEASEEDLIEAFNFAKPYLEKLYYFQKEISAKIGKQKIPLEKLEISEEVKKEAERFLRERLKEIVFQPKKSGELGKLEEEFLDNFKERENRKVLKNFFDEKVRETLTEEILNTNRRPDGRSPEEIREIECKVNVLPRTHGSGFFSRRDTKVLSILTLGAPGDVQLLEGMEISGKKRFLHHYNFPPYSTGEIRALKGPSRREIGHGVLVEKSLLPVIPDFENFPYTIRIVSEVLSSNGSTSMASVCASSLALFDAGVPAKKLVAGIALGLVSKDENYKILVDIQGPEDHFGQIDFKIAGTREGINAIQMDTKIPGITEKIFESLLKTGREKINIILDKMESVISKPREALSPFAPNILTLNINPEKIRYIIGPGGKVINEIIDKYQVSIDIEPSGKVFITGEEKRSVEKAARWIKNITREIRVGEIFYGKVKKILDIGIIVEILPGQDGLIHIKQLKRAGLKKPERFFEIGTIVPVKVISIDSSGKINLSLQKR